MRNFNKNNLLHVLALFQLHSIQHPGVPVYIYKYIYEFNLYWTYTNELKEFFKNKMNYKKKYIYIRNKCYQALIFDKLFEFWFSTNHDGLIKKNEP